jgi:hypothetical protein
MKIKNIIDIKFNFLAYFVPVILSLSCSDSPRQTNQSQNKIEHKATPKNKPPGAFSETIEINSPAAVFYSPDSLQLEKIKSVTDAMAFDGSMHEYYYLIRNAHFVIKKYIPQLKIIEAKNVRYLHFIRADKNTDCIDLDTKNDAYGLFVFDRKKPPRLLDMANIESELGFYFSKSNSLSMHIKEP